MSIAVIYRRRRDIEALSCLAVCAYLLSSSVLTPNSKLTECMRFVSKNRCKSNVLCFLPGQFVFEHGALNFCGRLDKKYIKKHFPKANYVDLDVIRQVSVPIGNSDLEELAGQFSTVSRPNEVGAKFEGELMYRSDALTVGYANAAYSLFTTYGLGAQGASRFFLLFWEEYMVHVRTRFVADEFKGEDLEQFSLGFECFGYQNDLKEFGTRITKSVYNVKNSTLSDRFSRLLPEISMTDMNNIPAIIKKVKLDGNWDKFGSRAAYLKLALNPGVHLHKLYGFRAFFLLAVHLHMEYIPNNSAKKLMMATEYVTKFQRTIPITKEGHKKPVFMRENTIYGELVADIEAGETEERGEHKRRRIA